jgi:ParB family chromosome partitioning protein
MPMLIPIDLIIVGPGHRKTTKGKVTELVASIETIGLKTPITVRPAKEAGKYMLVAGRHRIEAYRKLRRGEIEAVVLSATEAERDDQIEAQLWEHAENLHRSELSVAQRLVAQGRWLKLRAEKIKRQEQAEKAAAGFRPEDGNPLKPKGGRPSTTHIEAAAREMGIASKTARRAVFIADNLTPSAIKAAEGLGLENSQAALEAAAGVPEGYKEQVLENFAAQQDRKKREKAARAERQNGEGPAPPRTEQDIFDAWFFSLDIEERVRMRIWLLGLDLEAHFAEQDKTEQMLRDDRAALH